MALGIFLNDSLSLTTLPDMYEMYDVDRNGVQQHLYEAPTCDFKKSSNSMLKYLVVVDTGMYIPFGIMSNITYISAEITIL